MSDHPTGPVARPAPRRTQVERFDNAAVTPWFHLTPDLQVTSPVRDRAETSVNVGIRGKIDL